MVINITDTCVASESREPEVLASISHLENLVDTNLKLLEELQVRLNKVCRSKLSEPEDAKPPALIRCELANTIDKISNVMVSANNKISILLDVLEL